jgi:hypothetical protein
MNHRGKTCPRLEQAPFFGIFIDLKKAFDAMDRGRCLAILALYGVDM